MSRGYLFFFRSILCLIRHLLLRLYPYTECSCGITNRNNFFGDLKLKNVGPAFRFQSKISTLFTSRYRRQDTVSVLSNRMHNKSGPIFLEFKWCGDTFYILKRQQIAGHSPFKASFSSRSQNGHFFLRLWVIFLTFFQIG